MWKDAPLAGIMYDRLLDEDTEFINQLSQMDGVDSAVLVSYNGDYMGSVSYTHLTLPTILRV